MPELDKEAIDNLVQEMKEASAPLTEIAKLQAKLEVAEQEIDELREQLDFRKQVDKFIELVIQEIPGEQRFKESSVDFAFRLLQEGNNSKDDKIIKECKRSGEPYIVMRSKDDLARGALQFYMMRAVDEDCPPTFIEGLKTRFNEFQEWREANKHRTRMPD